MTYARAVFAFALLMLLAGILGSHYILTGIFGGARGPSTTLVGAASTRTPATASPTATPTATVLPTIPKSAAHRPTITATPTATPQPTPTTGVVTLARYWVGTTDVRQGQVVAIGYVIDNGTGHTARVMLGASLKSNRSLSWAGGSFSDPSHDVVAAVPPGISTHVRYFAIPPGIHPGTYDVAWGLRDAATGQRDALVAASGVLRVIA